MFTFLSVYTLYNKSCMVCYVVITNAYENQNGILKYVEHLF